MSGIKILGISNIMYALVLTGIAISISHRLDKLEVKLESLERAVGFDSQTYYMKSMLDRIDRIENGLLELRDKG